MAKSSEKIKARDFRKEGKSIKEIAQLLQVSAGTVSVWCSDITLTPAQNEILALRMTDPHYGKRAMYLKKIKRDTLDKIELLKKEGVGEIGTLQERDLFIAGVALYWAEGFKKDKQIGFANLDPKMINFFIKWLEVSLGVKKENISARVVINESYSDKIDEIQEYWSNMIGIPPSNFQKPTFQKVTWKKEYANKNEYKGVLRIRVAKSLPLLRKIFGYIEGLHASKSYLV